MQANVSDRMLVSAREAAQSLGVSSRTVWTWSAPRGPLAVVRIGRRTMYSLDDLRAFIAAQRQGAQQ